MNLSLGFLLVYILTITGCIPIQDTREYASTLADKNSLKYRQIQSGQFLLTTYSRISTKSNQLVVYIEGDGFAWKRRNILSNNPTPKNPMGLKLASLDKRDSILYIARPCQYLTNTQLVNCSSKYWSSLRYSREVIMAMNGVIQQFLINSNIQKISLVGYSGGGTVSVLIAAQRNDVENITTIAANLDLEKWTHIHNISPLTGSLNAADFASTTENIPQLHMVGNKDEIVPESIIYSYKSHSAHPDKIQIKVIPEFNHECCWEKYWIQLLDQNNLNQD